MNNYKFQKIGDFRGDISLIKGWYPMEESLFVDSDPLLKCCILYDCYQLYFEDLKSEILLWLDQNLLDKKVQLRQENT
jgi:hypothetical protein